MAAGAVLAAEPRRWNRRSGRSSWAADGARGGADSLPPLPPHVRCRRPPVCANLAPSRRARGPPSCGSPNLPGSLQHPCQRDRRGDSNVGVPSLTDLPTIAFLRLRQRFFDDNGHRAPRAPTGWGRPPDRRRFPPSLHRRQGGEADDDVVVARFRAVRPLARPGSTAQQDHVVRRRLASRQHRGAIGGTVSCPFSRSSFNQPSLAFRRTTDRLLNLVWPYFKVHELMYVVVPHMQLPLANITAVLSPGVITIRLNFS